MRLFRHRLPGSRSSRTACRTGVTSVIALLAPFAAIAANFVNAWEFNSQNGLQLDPTKIELVDGEARLRPQLLPTGNALQLNVFVDAQRGEVLDSMQQGLGLGTDDFLFLGWVKIRHPGASHAVFQKRALINGAMVGMLFQIEKVDAGHRLRAVVSAPGGSVDIATQVVIRDTGWNQVGIGIDRTRGRAHFYVNGKSFGGELDISAVTGSLASPAPFRIGLDDTSAQLRGDIDEVHFWRYQYGEGLPGDVGDIVDAHYRGITADTGSLVSAWRFNASNGLDSAGSNHLTLINSPAFLSADIYTYTDDGPYIEASCVAGAGASLYSANHLVNAPPGVAELRYQVSGDGTNWWYYSPQSGWTAATAATSSQASLLYHVRENLPDAPIQTGSFCFRVFFVSDGRSTVGLDRFEVVAPPPAVALVAEPAAGRPAPGSFHVIFETDYPAEAYVEYRPGATAPSRPWSATPVVTGGNVFGVDVTGLDPGADYEYRVRLRPRGTAAAFAATPAETLPVAPVVETPANIVFAVWGDSRPLLGEAQQPQVFYRMMEEIAGEEPVFHIAVGDNVNLSVAQPFNTETAIDFYRGWRDAYDIAGGTGYMFFALGNHDEDLTEPSRSLAVTARLRATVQPTDGDPEQRYYSWRWGDALFIAMDGSAANPKQAQADWVLQKIQQTARWKFVFNHYPFFNSDRGIGNIARRDELHAGFLAAGVDIVFQAHDHWYADAVVDGIHYTTTGGAGSPLRPEDAQFNPIVEYHYLRVELSHYSVTVSAIQVNENGTAGPLLDRYCVPASDAPATDTNGDGDMDVCDDDDDGDAIPDATDNCRLTANNDQRDTNGDGFGNACDADLDGNGFVNFADLAIFRAAFGTGNGDADLDGNGFVNFTDLATFRSLFGKAPGPAGN
jgi:hypothetical protein